MQKKLRTLKKRFDEMLMKINSLEKNINDLMELKNTTQELCKAYKLSIAESTKQKKGYQRLKINSKK